MPYASVSISQLQKRARDKEYRLRKKGALPNEITAVSPRVPMADVRNMTPAEKRSYRCKLEKFTSRDNRLVVYESGEVDPYSVLQSMTAKAKDYNKRARQESARIERLARKAGWGSRSDKSATVHGSLEKLPTKMTVPASRAAARRRAKQIDNMTNESWDAKRTRLRKNAKDALREVGMGDLCKYIDKLTPDQFDLLMSKKSNFWSLVNGIYVRADLGDPELSPDVVGGYANQVQAEIESAAVV